MMRQNMTQYESPLRLAASVVSEAATMLVAGAEDY